MRKKDLLKILDKLPDNTEIGLNVYTDVGTEFWGLDMSKVKVMDGGRTLSLGQLRQRKALPTRKLLKIDTPGADCINFEPEEVLNRFCDRYDIDDLKTDDISADELQELMLLTIRKDLQELVRLNDDLLRMYNDKKFTQRFRVN